jgi:hypothetical protein
MSTPQIGSTVTVPVKSAWYSKINWTQAVGIVATVIAVVTSNRVQIDPATQVSIVATIQGIVAVATWVQRTWFTTAVTPASVAS